MLICDNYEWNVLISLLDHCQNQDYSLTFKPKDPIFNRGEKVYIKGKKDDTLYQIRVRHEFPECQLLTFLTERPDNYNRDNSEIYQIGTKFVRNGTTHEFTVWQDFEMEACDLVTFLGLSPSPGIIDAAKVLKHLEGFPVAGILERAMVEELKIEAAKQDQEAA